MNNNRPYKSSRQNNIKSGQSRRSETRQPNFDQLTNLRAIACKVIHDVVSKNQSLATLLPVANEHISEKDKALLQEMVFGSCRWYFSLSKLSTQFLQKPLHRNDKIAETLITLGAYQLLYMRIPNHAALNETVGAAEQLGIANLKGLVNAVLRKVATLEVDHSVETDINSHPLWMQEKIKHNWPKHWQSILTQNNQHPPMTLRVNTQFKCKSMQPNSLQPKLQNNTTTPQTDYLKLLDEAEIEAKACEFSPTGISLTSACSVTHLPHFDDGAISVQDEAAQLCCTLLDLKPRMKVLDACAAPGGKTCAMLEQEPTLDMLALDADENRIHYILENLQRLNLHANVKTARAEDLTEWWDGQAFDRILLDAPCSATGVIRRHPDIKLLRKESDIKPLAELQLKILRALWPSLKQGGKLLYATCSIFPQENSRIIERFLKLEPSSCLQRIDADWGIDTHFGRQLLPQHNGHDGFFYACLSKTVLI